MKIDFLTSGGNEYSWFKAYAEMEWLFNFAIYSFEYCLNLES